MAHAGDDARLHQPTPRARDARHSFLGICAVCGWRGTFVQSGRPGQIGQDFPCSACRARLTIQAEACAVVDEFGRGRAAHLEGLLADPDFSMCRVHNIGVAGPLRERLKHLERYSESAFRPDLPLGARLPAKVERTNQDHERFTFDTGCFDLLLSSHVVEHVPDPKQAFAEAFRVLASGGRYVFSVPTRYPLPPFSRVRARVEHGNVVHLVDEPEYHNAPGGERALVFTNFGADVLDMLEAAGFVASIRRPHRAVEGARRNAVIVATKPG